MEESGGVAAGAETASSPGESLEEAERLLEEGVRLAAEQNAESRRRAIDALTVSAQLFERADDREQQGAALCRLGEVHARLGEPHESLAALEKSLAVSEDLGNQELLVSIYNNLGVVNNQVGKMEEALVFHEKALAIREAREDLAGEANSLNNLGRVHSNLGQRRQALGYYERSLALRRQVGDVSGVATTLLNMAAAYDSIGKPQAAIDSYRESYEIFHELGHKRGQAIVLNNLGFVYLSFGDPGTALNYFEQSLPIRRDSGDRLGEANTLGNLGSALLFLGRYDECLLRLQEALKVRETIGDEKGVATTLHNLGNLYLVQGNAREAHDYLERALPIRRQVHDRQGEGTTLAALSRARLMLGQTSDARTAASAALEIARAIDETLLEATAFFRLAEVDREEGDLPAAARHVEASLALVEDLRRAITSTDLKSSFMASRREIYDFYVDVLMRMEEANPGAGHAAAALRASERSRARTLQDLVQENRHEIRLDAKPSLLEKERQAAEVLAAKESRRRSLEGGAANATRVGELDREIEVALTHLDQLRAEVLTRSPRYASLIEPPILGLEEIQQLLPDDQTLLLEMTLGETRGFLWAVTRSSMEFRFLPGRAEVEADARRYHELVSAEPNELTKIPLAARAHKLSSTLLGPVQDLVANHRRLLIVADGALNYVPFSALPLPEAESGAGATELVVERHEVVNIPSASTLELLRQMAGGRDHQYTAAILADPVFESSDERLSLDARSTTDATGSTLVEAPTDLARLVMRDFNLASLERLASSRKEAEAIAEMLPPDERFIRLDFDATRETAIGQEVAGSKIVHLATHGFFDGEHPELSGLVLSLIDEQGQPVDGFLRLIDVYNLDLSADLVVLSSCRTALGEEVRGEGLVGLTRGFIYAGSESVLASLWDVDDSAAAQLMQHFYRGVLVEGLSYAAALRRAKRLLSSDPRYEAEYFWAGFVLQGEWRGRLTPPTSR